MNTNNNIQYNNSPVDYNVQNQGNSNGWNSSNAGNQVINMGNNRSNHSHGINNAANHTHSISSSSLSNAGNGDPVDFRPKYFAVQYIIKVS